MLYHILSSIPEHVHIVKPWLLWALTVYTFVILSLEIAFFFSGHQEVYESFPRGTMRMLLY
jgi:hypothetical protein